MEAAHAGWTDFINNAKVHDIDVQISALCRASSNCVPATGLMARKMVDRTSDGIHPTAAESIEMARQLFPGLGLVERRNAFGDQPNRDKK